MKTDSEDSTEETPAASLGRRSFLSKASMFGALAALSPAALLMTSRSARAATSPEQDLAVLNFALNLEYLEAEYYLYATQGSGLPTQFTTGSGLRGATSVKAGATVPFQTAAFQQYAVETARDELNHVKALRATIKSLGGTPVAKPRLDLQASFAGLGSLIGAPGFDPFASEVNFLLGSFVFEDVGVTAYGGAAALLDNKAVLSAAASILAVEAYHAGSVRTVLYGLGAQVQDLANKISRVRASLGGGRDQGIEFGGVANIIPTDANSLAFRRNTRQVLNIVYGKTNARRGLFFPAGLNGAIK